MSKLRTPDDGQIDTDGSEVDDSESSWRSRFGILGKTMSAMLIVGLLPLALFGGLTLRQQGDRFRADTERSMQASGERISAQVDEWIDKNVRVLQAAANLPTVGSMQQGDQSKVLAAIRQAYPWMYLVFTVGTDGKNVARSDDKPPTNYSDRQYYKDVVANGKELSWETLIGKTSNKPALVLSVPIKANGQLVGVMAAAMSIEDISQIVANWRTGQTGFAFLVDEKAKVVAHPSDEFVTSQANMNQHPLISSLQSNRQPHLMSFTKTDGKQALGYVHANKFRWAVAVQQDETEVFAPLRDTLKLGLALLAAAAVLVALIAVLSARMLVQPILEMTRAADRMSMGELDAPIVLTRRDELGQLAQSLERLRKSVKAAFDRLRSAA